MSSQQNRRQLMQWLGSMAGAGALGAFAARADQAAPAPSMRTLPWPYHPLDPDTVAQRAFESFSKGGCSYAAFEAIAASVAERLGAPYKDFPFEMFAYGNGGISGWATICGALNGSAAAFQLLSPKPGPLVDALFGWYESEPLPDFRPKGAKFAEVRSVTGSPLCHQSITLWSKASGKSAYSPERSERCGALTAAVVRKAVLLLNDQVASRPVSFALPGATQSCMSCHGRGSTKQNVLTKMDCGGCHAPQVAKHSKRS
jgi:hypothetical protein